MPQYHFSTRYHCGKRSIIAIAISTLEKLNREDENRYGFGVICLYLIAIDDDFETLRDGPITEHAE